MRLQIAFESVEEILSVRNNHTCIGRLLQALTMNIVSSRKVCHGIGNGYSDMKEEVLWCWILQSCIQIASITVFENQAICQWVLMLNTTKQPYHIRMVQTLEGGNLESGKRNWLSAIYANHGLSRSHRVWVASC